MMTVSELLSTADQDHFWMNHALSLAEKAEQQGEIPVGAVLVKGTELVAEGWNQTIQSHDPTAHAEVIALRKAGLEVGNYRLNDLTLYVTLEPCPMCAGAMIHARIKRLVIAAKDFRTGAAGSLINLVQEPRLNHQVKTDFGVLESEASEMLSGFFRKRRLEKKEARQKSLES
ncbi:tRNA adenosine(34) deaminase TadA [Hydrogenovibrio sp. 3SP14C1]|uniref:tRNA adenosine(34) deaminase TadA n=1 Tax=Hydrogenovibrio sp. 3SP14C1 TaxID=3038774 RepID=UPI002417473E|nr:tRNA adenosine(34) deaminase TadA [Hydrogenovibrio sp. 3SP14C1]MDG4812181.1 tRNA adenosine(34) deaminase TadA [Hydrogenovibrio sp. 3SP14C1]